MSSTLVRGRRDVGKFEAGLYEFENSQKGIKPWRLLPRNGTRLRERHVPRRRSLGELTRRGRVDEETFAFEISIIVTVFFLPLVVLKIGLQFF